MKRFPVIDPIWGSFWATFLQFQTKKDFQHKPMHNIW